MAKEKFKFVLTNDVEKLPFFWIGGHYKKKKIASVYLNSNLSQYDVAWLFDVGQPDVQRAIRFLKDAGVLVPK
jgi:hypothetical protein